MSSSSESESESAPTSATDDRGSETVAVLLTRDELVELAGMVRGTRGVVDDVARWDALAQRLEEVAKNGHATDPGDVTVRMDQETFQKMAPAIAQAVMTQSMHEMGMSLGRKMAAKKRLHLRGTAEGKTLCGDEGPITPGAFSEDWSLMPPCPYCKKIAEGGGVP